VELFINDSYEGVYNLMEKLDEHILQFNKYQYETGGVMYKAMGYGEGSTSFYSCCAPFPEGFLWESWEQIYPAHEAMWEPLETMRYLVVHSDDEEFGSQIGEVADIEMLADYYLYINLLMALDNIGKNTFLARFNSSSPFFILPWDVEASLGKLWDGQDAVEHIMATNNLFNRLIETNAEDFNELVEETTEMLQPLVGEGVELVLHGHAHRASLGHVDTVVGEAPIFGVTSASALGRARKRQARYHIYRLEKKPHGWEMAVSVRCYSPPSESFVEDTETNVVLSRPTA